MQPREVTAITNFAVGGEALFAAGFLIGNAASVLSARGFWALGILSLAVAFLTGGIDHAFFEPKGNTRARTVVRKVSWLWTGVATCLITISTAYQFASGGIRTAVVLAGLAQLVIFLCVSMMIHHFLVVMINYIPILVALLILNVLGLSGGSGSWYMVVGIAVTMLASACEALSVDILSPVDRHGLYHLVMTVAIAFLFLGAFGLKAHS